MKREGARRVCDLAVPKHPSPVQNFPAQPDEVPIVNNAWHSPKRISECERFRTRLQTIFRLRVKALARESPKAMKDLVQGKNIGKKKRSQPFGRNPPSTSGLVKLLRGAPLPILFALLVFLRRILPVRIDIALLARLTALSGILSGLALA